MLEVFTIGGGEYIVNVFNAVAAWSGGGGYRALIRVVMVMGLIYSLLTMAWNLDARVLWKWFVQATAMYLVLMVPTVNIKVTDRTNPSLAPATVSNVPLGLGMMASFTSQVGDWLTRTAETVFVMPAALDYSTGGMIYGAKLLDNTQNQAITNAALATNVNEYLRSCLFYDVLIHGKSLQGVLESPDLMTAIGPGSVSLSMVWRDGVGTETVVACNIGYQNVVTAFNADYAAAIQKIASQTYPGLTPAAALNRYNLDVGAVGNAGLGAGMTSAQQLTRQAMMIDAVLKARSTFGGNSVQAQVDAFAQQRADVQTRNTYATIAGGAMKWVPLLNVVLTVVFYAMFPVIFLLMLMPNGGLAVAKGYITGFFYLASWGPLFVVLNMIFMTRWQSALNSWQMGGLTAANFSAVSSINQDAAALAGYMIMSVPFIAAGMARGAMGIASHSASFLAPSQNAAEQAAAESTTGNYNYGNISLANRTMNTDTIDQHRTAPSWFTGAGYRTERQRDGTEISTTAGGQLVYNSEPGISRPGFSVSYTQDYARDARTLLSQGSAVVEQKRAAASQAWSAVDNQGATLMDTVQRTVSSGSESGSGLTASASRMSSFSENLSRQLQNKYGFDKSTADTFARDSVMSGQASLGIGGEGVGFSATASSAARRMTSDEFRSSNQFSDVNSFVNGQLQSEEYRSTRDSFFRATSSSTNSDVRSAAGKFEASLSEARSASLESSRAEETWNRYSTEFSEANNNGLRMSRNVTQEATQFMTAEMAKPENEVLRSTGYYPGMPAPNADQRVVENALLGKFLASKRTTMAADLGVIPGGPVFRLDGPASTNPTQVQEWGADRIGAVQSQAPRISVRGDSFDQGLSNAVDARLTSGEQQISEAGMSFRHDNFGARNAGDTLRDGVDSRNGASLGGTMPFIGNLMNAADIPGSTNRPFSGPVDARLPSRGLGFTTYGRGPSGSNQMGTEGFVSELQNLSRAWSSNGHAPIAFGDLSVPGGGPMNGHDGHRSGREVDIRPFRTDRRNAPTTWNDPSYDRAATRDFVMMVRQRDPGAVILFNDPVLLNEGIVQRWDGHDNHLHLRLGNRRRGKKS